MRTQCLTVCQIGKRGGEGELRGCKVRFVHSLGDVPCFCERAGAVFFWETFRTGGPMQIGRTEQVRFSTVSNNKKSPASDFSHPPPKFVRACILNNTLCTGKSIAKEFFSKRKKFSFENGHLVIHERQTSLILLIYQQRNWFVATEVKSNWKLLLTILSPLNSFPPPPFHEIPSLHARWCISRHHFPDDGRDVIRGLQPLFFLLYGSILYAIYLAEGRRSIIEITSQVTSLDGFLTYASYLEEENGARVRRRRGGRKN